MVLKNILTVLRKLASAAMNFLIVYFETIAVPMSWAMGGTIMFTMYTELSNIFNGAVCLLVGLWQLSCIFTGWELPLWLKRLKFISTSCLAMTFLTVVIILAPMYEDGNGWYIMLFTGSMLYHHFLDPVLAILSLVLFERLPRLPLGQVWWALVPTILYGLYDLHGNITGAIDGPYPFMRVYDQTIQETLMWFTIILVTNLLYAFLLWWLGGNGRKSKDSDVIEIIFSRVIRIKLTHRIVMVDQTDRITVFVIALDQIGPCDPSARSCLVFNDNIDSHYFRKSLCKIAGTNVGSAAG